MPLETATTISDLNASNPAHSDGLSQTDSHLRLLKSTLKATFPNITSSVISTQSALDAGAAAGANGSSLLADGGASFKTNSGNGIVDVSSSEMDFKVGGTVVAKLHSDGSTALQGPLSTTGSISSLGALGAAGPFIGGTGQLALVGEPRLWLSDVLPSANFAWLNGASVSRASYPVLFALWGVKFGVGLGDGLTFSLPDWREVIPIGKSTMGSTTARNLVTQYQTAGQLDTLGALVGEAKHTLAAGELPVHDHNTAVTEIPHTHPTPRGGSTGTAQGGPDSAFSFAGPAAGSTSAASTGLTVVVNDSGKTRGAAFNTLQPSAVCSWITLLG